MGSFRPAWPPLAFKKDRSRELGGFHFSRRHPRDPPAGSRVEEYNPGTKSTRGFVSTILGAGWLSMLMLNVVSVSAEVVQKLKMSDKSLVLDSESPENPWKNV